MEQSSPDAADIPGHSLMPCAGPPGPGNKIPVPIGLAAKFGRGNVGLVSSNCKIPDGCLIGIHYIQFRSRWEIPVCFPVHIEIGANLRRIMKLGTGSDRIRIGGNQRCCIRFARWITGGSGVAVRQAGVYPVAIGIIPWEDEA